MGILRDKQDEATCIELKLIDGFYYTSTIKLISTIS